MADVNALIGVGVEQSGLLSVQVRGKRYPGCGSSLYSVVINLAKWWLRSLCGFSVEHLVVKLQTTRPQLGSYLPTAYL